MQHETTIHVRWGELDPYNHVNHSTYLSYLEHARIQVLDEIGWPMERIASEGYQVVVIAVDIRFKRPATGGDDLIVVSGLTELRRASSVWHQRIERDGELLVEAWVTSACTTLEGRPTRTPEAFQRVLEDLLETPAVE